MRAAREGRPDDRALVRYGRRWAAWCPSGVEPGDDGAEVSGVIVAEGALRLLAASAEGALLLWKTCSGPILRR